MLKNCKSYQCNDWEWLIISKLVEWTICVQCSLVRDLDQNITYLCWLADFVCNKTIITEKRGYQEIVYLFNGVRLAKKKNSQFLGLHLKMLNRADRSCTISFVNRLKNYPGWALIDIQSFSALIQRFLRFQRCSELNQPTLILTFLVITDSVMNISEHLWFSAEHYWQAANRQRPWKKPKKCFFSKLMLKRREIKNFRTIFNGLFWKILKMWFFRNLYFLLIPCQKTSY